MNWNQLARALGRTACALAFALSIAQPEAAPSSWERGPRFGPEDFPIGVWLQNPRNAERYRAAGINLYVGLWKGPTESQLSELRAAGLSVICSQTETGLRLQDDPTIVGWMHNDEPDNAQSLGEGRGYGPPVKPETVIRRYREMRAADPSRPVFLNLGQAVAWDNYIGRGVRRNHPEDYLEYVKGADIVSFDIYPAVHSDPAIAGKLEWLARGVERLREWTNGEKPVWNCIECTRIGNPEVKPTPDQVRAEVWMSIVHGSRGLIYFVHQFEPVFREAALLDDPEMLAAVTEINARVRSLAPVLNSAAPDPVAVAESTAPDVPIALLAKRRGEAVYLFAVCMRGQPTTGRFRIEGLSPETTARVLGESRALSVRDGAFEDAFDPYGVHIYRIED